MEWTELPNLNDRRFAPYRRLRQTALDITLGPGYFIAESQKVVKKLLSSNIETHSVLGTRDQLSEIQDEILKSQLTPGDIFCVPIESMEAIVGMSLHQGIMAIAKRPSLNNLAELGARIIMLNGVVNPENVGSIVRSAAGFEFDSIVFDQLSSDPFVRRAVRVSMGNAFNMKTHRTEKLSETIETLKSCGYTIIGSDFRQATDLLGQFDFPKKYALIIGSEVHGMEANLIKQCDHVLKIDTTVPLNASHAATVLLYESNRNNSIS